MSKYSKPLLFVHLYLLINAAICQKIAPEDLNLATKIKGHLPSEQKAVIKDSEIIYTFSEHATIHTMNALYEETTNYLGLRPGGSLIITNYYDSHSSIENYKLTNTKNRSLDIDKLCGHSSGSSIFYSDFKSCKYGYTIGQLGEVIRFSTTINYADTRYLTRVVFQDNVHIIKRKITFKIPSAFEVALVEKNFEGYNISKKSFSENGFEIIEYTLNDIESIPIETSSPGRMYFVPHVLILSKSATIRGVTASIVASNDDLYKFYQTLKIGMNNDSNELKEKVEEIISEANLSEHEKIEKLYYWVQDNIKYIAFEDGIAAFQPEDAQKVLYNRYGDCKGMSNLLKEMLIIEGFDARLTWVGTRRIPYNHAYPSLAMDNHMVCSVVINDSVLVLDPTERFQRTGVYSDRIQNRKMIIEDGDTYLFHKIEKQSIDAFLEYDQHDFVIADNKFLSGKGTKTLYDETKKQIKVLLDGTKKNAHEKILSYIVNNGNTNEYELLNQPTFDRENNTIIEYGMKLDNRVQNYNNELFVDLVIERHYSKFKIKDDRKTPYDLETRRFVHQETTLSIDDNLTCTYIPEAFKVKNNLFNINMNYSIKGNEILLSKKIQVLQSIIYPENFKVWNQTVSGLKKFYNDQVILKLN